MTARQFAALCGVEVIGKLRKRSVTSEEFDWGEGRMTNRTITFFVDDAGNEFHGDSHGWTIIDAEGGVH